MVKATEITLTKEVDYVDAGGNFCPYCGSSRIHALQPKLDDIFDTAEKGDTSNVTARVACKTCGGAWTNVYKLIGIEEAK